MFVQTEVTPNPNSLKFLPEKKVSNSGPYEITKKDNVKNELVRNILAINGVEGVFLGENFISVNKKNLMKWDDIKHIVISLINDFYSDGNEFVIDENLKEQKSNLGDIEQKIVKILDQKIRPAVAKAAIDSGVARKKIENFDLYKDQLKQRLDPTVTIMQGINSYIKKNQKRIVFADGEDENTLKAAIAFKNSKLGIPILVGKEIKIKEQIKKIGYNENFDIEIVNSTDKVKRKKYVKHLFKKLQRDQGFLERDCDRLVRNDRVVWATSMVACGDADGAVTGNTRRFGSSLDKIKQVVDARNGEIMFGLNMVVHKGKTIFVGDTSVHEYPTSEQMAEIAISTARVVRLFGFEPKVAFVSHSTFGQPLTSRTKHIRKSVEILREKKVDFQFDGDMQPDVALNSEYKELYPFSKIVGEANILIMPGQHSAAISYKMMKTLGDTKVIGPLLIGLGLPIEIAPLRTSTSEIINLASIAAYSADVIDY